MNLLGGVTFNRLEAGLQAANVRQRVLANNIANVDTPYFKRAEVQFESVLSEQVEGEMPQLVGRVTDRRHFRIGPVNFVPESVVTIDPYSTMNNNFNNVDVDREMSLMAENQLRYNAYIQQVNDRIKMVRTAIEGRN
ncbi:Flagellar basal body rod protein FlgB [compost metagenome]